MKKLIFLIIFVFAALSFAASVFGQNSEKPVADFDEKMAKELGADDYGMKSYVVAILKKGGKTGDEKERQSLQEAHIKNIFRLAEEGKIVLAGPFTDDKGLQGIFIFDVRTTAEAQKLIETDPMVKAGYLEFELRIWYGSAAVTGIPKIHKKIQKKKVF